MMTPSPTLRHNLIRDRIAGKLRDFVKAHHLGVITIENDFRLKPDVVRCPDIAFLTNEQLGLFDVDRSPIEGAPALAVEVVSPGNLAEDMLLKVHQYRGAGCHAVWVAYPGANLIVVHDQSGIREARGALEEPALFSGIKFTLPLPYIFDRNLTS